MRQGLLLALVLAACTSAEPRPEPAPATPPAVTVEGPVPAAELHEASHWYWDLDTRVWDARAIPEGWRLVGDRPLRLQLMRKGAVVIEVDVPHAAHHDTGVVAVHEDAVYVAHHSGIASGTTLTRFGATDGRVVWSTPLEGIGPTDHSKYRNEVQIAIEHGNPVVFGHEAHGDYTEIVDARTGRTIAHDQPPQVLVTLEWSFLRLTVPPDRPGLEWSDLPPKGPVSLVAKYGTFTFREAEAKDESASVHLVEKDTPIWATELPGNAFCGRAAMHELFGTLWIVRFCEIATGAELVGIDVKTGDVRVSRRLRALPDIGHSEYLAAVQLRDVAGYLVVMGNEAGGRYLEAIHPETGATVVSRTWK